MGAPRRRWGYTRTLPGDSQSFSVKLSASQEHDVVRNVDAYSYTLPVQPDLDQDLTRVSSFPQLDLKIDYKKTLPNKAKLMIGYEGKFDWQGERNDGTQGSSAVAAISDPDFTEHFTFDQQVHAIYATYEEAFGKLTVQPGLRLEDTTITTDLVSTAQTERHAYFEAYPSLHLDYALDDTSDLKASYGRRVQGPDESQLDPFRIEGSPTAFIAGNPDLKPAITQSWELGYE